MTGKFDLPLKEEIGDKIIGHSQRQTNCRIGKIRLYPDEKSCKTQ